MSLDIYFVVEHLREQVADLSYVMAAAARGLAQETGGQAVAVLLGNQVRELAGGLDADRVVYVQHPALADFSSDAYQRVLEKVIGEDRPRAVIFGDTSVGGDVAGWLSARLSLPLVGHCRTLSAQGETLSFSSRTCGGRITVEGELPGPTALVMMDPGGYRLEQGRAESAKPTSTVAPPPLDDLRVKIVDYVEAAVGDVDIAKEAVLVSVGRGIQNKDNIELVEALAKALGAQVSCSRPVVDQGWLPTTRLVGKSGKHVKPKVYLALGISGAPEHVEAITDAETVVAINTDASAPIYGVAQYGSTVDLLDLVPALTERVAQARQS